MFFFSNQKLCQVFVTFSMFFDIYLSAFSWLFPYVVRVLAQGQLIVSVLRNPVKPSCSPVKPSKALPPFWEQLKLSKSLKGQSLTLPIGLFAILCKVSFSHFLSCFSTWLVAECARLHLISLWGDINLVSFPSICLNNDSKLFLKESVVQFERRSGNILPRFFSLSCSLFWWYYISFCNLKEWAASNFALPTRALILSCGWV